VGLQLQHIPIPPPAAPALDPGRAVPGAYNTFHIPVDGITQYSNTTYSSHAQTYHVYCKIYQLNDNKLTLTIFF